MFLRDTARSARRRLINGYELLTAPREREVLCPVCDFYLTKRITYARAPHIDGPSASLPEVVNHVKHLCANCLHLFSPWLDAELDVVSDRYSGVYAEDVTLHENERARIQLALLRYAKSHTLSPNAPETRLLDFGCGPNHSPSRQLRQEGIDARACDILDGFPYDDEFLFRHELHDKKWFGAFDAISSVDVLEHLGRTRDVWTHFNRLLRVGGVMAHCFPTLLHYDVRHPYCANPFHVCIFSRRSLDLLCRETGFALEAIEPFDADVPWVFKFRKVAELA